MPHITTFSTDSGIIGIGLPPLAARRANTDTFSCTSEHGTAMKNTHTPLYSHNLHHSYILFADTREAAALNSLYNIGFEYYPEVETKK